MKDAETRRYDLAISKLPVYLDGYALICGHLAQGDTDAAWRVAFQLSRSAKTLKPDLFEVYRNRGIMRNWRNNAKDRN